MSSSAPGADAPNFDSALLLEKCERFVDFALWPSGDVIGPKRWLGNFKPAELECAYHLLNAFVFYSDRLVEHVFAAGFHHLSNLVRSKGQGFVDSKSAWHRFLDQILVTYVTGENPNPTDSGLAFARKARKVLGIPEDQILSPEQTLHILSSNPLRPVLFVDDFVGSGNQFKETWQRKYLSISGMPVSFEAHSANFPGSKYFYCPAMCTTYGRQEIEKVCGSQLLISPGNWIPEESGVFHANSSVWPPHLRSAGPEFVRVTSERAGIPDTDGGVDDWRGFHKLGLTLSFVDSIPDATLPIFYWEQNGWVPLIRRAA